MDYERIVELIKAAGVEATLMKVTKGSEIVTGITVGGGTVRPTVYPDKFGAAGTEEEIAEAIIRGYKEVVRPEVNTEVITDAEYIKKNVLLAVRRPVEDGAYSKNYLDMQTVLKVKVPDCGEGLAAYTLNKDLAIAKGLTEDIFDQALKNTEYVVSTIEEKLLGLIPAGSDSGMYVLSNKYNAYGASAICNTDLLEELAVKLDSDLTIIPSSTHEILAVKFTPDMDIAEVNEMVIAVNGEAVDPTEQLSNHAYYYRKGSKQLTW